MNIRIGNGYDIHRLEPGRDLILGGIKIEFQKGLLGHSDADVLAHAIIDALLGAAGLRDIGVHFPDSSAEYFEADSVELLKKVVQMIWDKGYTIGNVDSVVIAEAPRLEPFIEHMRVKLANAMGIEKDQVNVKATTSEGLDAIGNVDAIAAHAVALIQKTSS